LREALCALSLIIGTSAQCTAQHWELGAMGGYGWYQSSTISNSLVPDLTSGEIGFPSRGTIGVVFGESPYHHLGGEVKWLYQWGGPQIEAGGIKNSIPGYSNLVTYDFIIYPLSSESGFRPYVAGGAGVRAYTGTDFGFFDQFPTARLAALRSVTQAEAAISVGAGLKYVFRKHAQFRLDLHGYFTPTPDDVIRPNRFSVIHGWLTEVTPTAGFSYVFR
jgi:hypothetical protein